MRKIGAILVIFRDWRNCRSDAISAVNCRLSLFDRSESRNSWSRTSICRRVKEKSGGILASVILNWGKSGNVEIRQLLENLEKYVWTVWSLKPQNIEAKRKICEKTPFWLERVVCYEKNHWKSLPPGLFDAFSLEAEDILQIESSVKVSKGPRGENFPSNFELKNTERNNCKTSKSHFELKFNSLFLQILPGLESFCAYCAIGIGAIYLFQCSWFVAWLSIDQRRIEARRDGLIPCCLVHREWSKESSQSQENWARNCLNYWANLVKVKTFKVLFQLSPCTPFFSIFTKFFASWWKIQKWVDRRV